MKLEGKDVDESVNGWIKEELKTSPLRIYDLGKFYFTVSSTTIGLILLAEKVDNAEWDCFLILSMLAIALSGILALWMVIPRDLKLENDPDLQDLRNGIITKIKISSWLWFLLWSLGLVLGALAVIG